MVIGFILLSGEGIYIYIYPLLNLSLACASFGVESVIYEWLFVVCYAAILVHRWLPGSRGLKKLVHLWLQGVALACGVFGIWTRFQGKDGIVANFYSLHSWMGLVCVSLFAAQVFAFTLPLSNFLTCFLYLVHYFFFVINVFSWVWSF